MADDSVVSSRRGAAVLSSGAGLVLLPSGVGLILGLGAALVTLGAMLTAAGLLLGWES